MLTYIARLVIGGSSTVSVIEDEPPPGSLTFTRWHGDLLRRYIRRSPGEYKTGIYIVCSPGLNLTLSAHTFEVDAEGIVRLRVVAHEAPTWVAHWPPRKP